MHCVLQTVLFTVQTITFIYTPTVISSAVCQNNKDIQSVSQSVSQSMYKVGLRSVLLTLHHISELLNGVIISRSTNLTTPYVCCLVELVLYCLCVFFNLSHIDSSFC